MDDTHIVTNPNHQYMCSTCLYNNKCEKQQQLGTFIEDTLVALRKLNNSPYDPFTVAISCKHYISCKSEVILDA